MLPTPIPLQQTLESFPSRSPTPFSHRVKVSVSLRVVPGFALLVFEDPVGFSVDTIQRLSVSLIDVRLSGFCVGEVADGEV